MNREELPYRACVGIVLANRRGRVFVGRRADQKTASWQFPQGGIDEGEMPRTAALRELEEEIGTDRAEVIGESDGWLTYELPDELLGKVWKGKYRGQRQKWFAMRFTGKDQDIRIDTEHPEFDAWKWVELARVPKLIVPWKRAVYEQVVVELGPMIADAARPTRARRS
jgi:putative (di)nucleoside polyphosphate hydrolase